MSKKNTKDIELFVDFSGILIKTHLNQKRIQCLQKHKKYLFYIFCTEKENH